MIDVGPFFETVDAREMPLQRSVLPDAVAQTRSVSDDVRHVYIRPRTPRLNGTVERSHRVDDQEFYQLLDKDGISDAIHLLNEKCGKRRMTKLISRFHERG